MPPVISPERDNENQIPLVKKACHIEIRQSLGLNLLQRRGTGILVYTNYSD